MAQGTKGSMTHRNFCHQDKRAGCEAVSESEMSARARGTDASEASARGRDASEESVGASSERTVELIFSLGLSKVLTKLATGAVSMIARWERVVN